MKIIPLSEGTFTIDKSKLFVPFDGEVDKIESRPVGSLLVEIQPFLIVLKDDILLLDTGLGFERNGEMQLLTNIKAAGIEPGQVTKVLLSHLHKDHAGGVGKEREGLGARLSIPNAKYYVQHAEFTYAFKKGMPSFIPLELEALRNNDQVIFLEGDGVIDDYIKYEVTAAHSPHHQVFWITEGNETLFFGADDAPQLQQMKHRFVAKYDFNGKKAMELRQKWWEEGNRNGWKFLFYHDVSNPIYTNRQE